MLIDHETIAPNLTTKIGFSVSVNSNLRYKKFSNKILSIVQRY